MRQIILAPTGSSNQNFDSKSRLPQLPYRLMEVVQSIADPDHQHWSLRYGCARVIRRDISEVGVSL